ncbi:hypothetical protein GCM10009714_34830 [Microlunatus capsulatus]
MMRTVDVRGLVTGRGSQDGTVPAGASAESIQPEPSKSCILVNGTGSRRPAALPRKHLDAEILQARPPEEGQA